MFSVTPSAQDTITPNRDRGIDESGLGKNQNGDIVKNTYFPAG
jgi:hypothetical protein